MSESKTMKANVLDKYDAIARSDGTSGCGCGCSTDVSMIGDEYDGVDGYVAEADMKLGCGMPTELADLKPGQSVLDLGSGAGLDAFIARRIIGETGRVVGVDMTPSMIERARANAEALGHENVTFIEGEIEELPLDDDGFDVAISNCVLNLVPDKARAFSEMYRVLRPGGHFCVSDVVVVGKLPESIRQSAELYAGCVAGALDRDHYLDMLGEAGFEDVKVERSREIDVPSSVLLEAVSKEELKRFRTSGGSLVSVTVTGKKSRKG